MVSANSHVSNLLQHRLPHWLRQGLSDDAHDVLKTATQPAIIRIRRYLPLVAGIAVPLAN